MATSRFFALLLILVALAGCTRVVVNKNPSERDRGIRYYRPKPYLFIMPGTSSPEEKEPTFTAKCDVIQNKEVEALIKDARSKGVVRDENTLVDYATESLELFEASPNANFKADCPSGKDRPGTKVSIKMMYMPDFAEEYSIRLMPGLGIGELTLKLDDGWNLTSVGMKTDQQTDEIISSTADLIGAIGAPVSNDKSATNPPTNRKRECIELLATNIPFGFYEAVVAEDCYGRKQLYGWRYVGFMPFQACPVEPCGMQQATCHDPNVIYGMVIDQCGVLRFEPLCKIPSMDPGASQACRDISPDADSTQPAGPSGNQSAKRRPKIISSLNRLRKSPLATIAPGPPPVTSE